MGKRQLRTWLFWLWDTFKPPSGVQARRVVMAFTALVMVGRFGLLRLTSPGSAARINVIQSWQYGVAYAQAALYAYSVGGGDVYFQTASS